ncbi:SGNH/GDSL hydrolase family protein [Bradyrhizobium sp. LHD-71]|uniref:SGNH/GDSL hydrolase family protein n=1 Tax=Bradyrhizobium sp. LHD-71 TaxID=3072141 RepID=UPI00280E672B|nr:SGNH/GDSL hydrolase family protein [Bradyrhizobium sp. LHD-71]MDQ8730323.1 SGNH/GDSL hydrolase family protein [Bradyrhizobium sp. LHD-71]
MKAFFSAVVIAGFFAAAPACAQELKGAEPKPADRACDVPADLLAVGDITLEKVARAVKDTRALDVLVVGSGSSSLASPDGALTAYPARLEASLREKLPGVAVTVTTKLQPKRTAEDVVETLSALVIERKPNLLVWQTGTVDAIRAIHLDDFRNALDEGTAAVKAAGTDVVLMNLQYSPRMETMIPTSPYLDNIRAVAQQQDVPLFDRYAIMQNWNETGEFDLSNSSRSFALAKGVHDCLGQALANLVISAARLDPAEPKVQN